MDDVIDIALAEDLGSGDVTCDYFVLGSQRGKGRIVAKESAIVAGLGTASEVFSRVDPSLEIHIFCQSGASVKAGDPVLEVNGRVKSILMAERVALNFLQRLSGVATLTRRFVDAAGTGGAKVLDTRKTTPGLRVLEKAAVVAGGGQNHRFGLYDMVMIKDNHLAAKGDLVAMQAAIDRLRIERPEIRVELEADTVEQVRGFLELRGVNVILLDNMSEEHMRESVRIGANRVQFEASGGITLDTIAGIAATGVDFVSVGALTHSARAIDFSLDLELE